MLTLGAAAFGAFVSVPGALVGGLVLGLVSQIVSAETSNATTAEMWVFALILAIVFVRGRAIARVFELSGPPVEEPPVTRVPESLRDKAIVRHQSLWLGGFALIVPGRVAAAAVLRRDRPPVPRDARARSTHCSASR